ncbi:MAG: hypothetical protein ABIN57_02595 [Chitinophagaceae bacterium]
MRIIIEIDHNKEGSVQVSGAVKETQSSLNTSRPDINAVDAGRAKVGTETQGSQQAIQNNSLAHQESTSGGSGPGNQVG